MPPPFSKFRENSPSALCMRIHRFYPDILFYRPSLPNCRIRSGLRRTGPPPPPPVFGQFGPLALPGSGVSASASQSAGITGGPPTWPPLNAQHTSHSHPCSYTSFLPSTRGRRARLGRSVKALTIQASTFLSSTHAFFLPLHVLWACTRRLQAISDGLSDQSQPWTSAGCLLMMPRLAGDCSSSRASHTYEYGLTGPGQASLTVSSSDF